jgi:glycine cleavage system H lipoate-binding protein
VRLVTPSTQESGSQREFNVPAGIFVAPNHTWVNIEMNGAARIGMDDFIRKTIPDIAAIELPEPDKKVNRGEPLFSIRHNSRTIDICSPISGRVTVVNEEHGEHPEWLASKPFELSWMCCIEPSKLSDELHALKIGADSVSWYRQEIDKYSDLVKGAGKAFAQATAGSKSDDKDDKFVDTFARTFLAAPTF